MLIERNDKYYWQLRVAIAVVEVVVVVIGLGKAVERLLLTVQSTSTQLTVNLS